MPDLSSNHRAHRQALDRALPVIFAKNANIASAPVGTSTEVRVSTVRKKDCPLLSFVDYWLWAYARRHDRQDPAVFPAELEARTHVRVMTPQEVVGAVRASGEQ